MKIVCGDIVVRRSYNGDVYFIVTEIKGNIAMLQGLFHRLFADAPLEDLIVLSEKKVKTLLHNKNYSNFSR